MHFVIIEVRWKYRVSVFVIFLKSVFFNTLSLDMYVRNDISYSNSKPILCCHNI